MTMTRREMLELQLEDALFALMMDHAAVQEGAQAWEENERLLADESAAVPEAADRRFRRTIARSFAKQRAIAAGRVIRKTLNAAAIVVCVVALTLTGAFAASEQVRTDVLNFVIEASGKTVSVGFAGAEADRRDGGEVAVGWLPEGFMLAESGVDRYESWAIYRNMESPAQEIALFRSSDVSGELILDAEDGETQTLTVRGFPAVCIQREDPQCGSVVTITWGMEESRSVCTLTGTGVETEVLLQIANSVE